MAKPAVNLILDSGAFSAWKRQEDLTVEQYIDFVEKYHDCLKAFVNLDVIPGHWGKVPSDAEVEQSAADGWKNLMKMRKAGLDAMPVYHMGERRYWLDRMIGEGFDYIGISPANDRTSDQKKAWLDEVFSYLCGGKGFPSIKTHGFGVTALPLLFRYPWYSGDSITYLLIGGYGSILVPPPKGNEYDYTIAPYVVRLSDRGVDPGSVVLGLRNFSTMGRSSQDYVAGYVEEQGYDLDELKKSYEMRVRANVKFFLNVSSHYSPRPFKMTRCGLFDHKPNTSFGQEESINEWIKIVFTVNSSRQHSDVLQAEGARNRLFSYFWFKDKETWSIRDYVQTGVVPASTRRKKEKRKRLAPVSDVEEYD